MIAIKLREAMEAYFRRTRERVTYKKLAEWTGLSEDTFESIGGRLDHKPSLDTIEKICVALHVTPGDLLEIIPDKPRKSKKKKKRSRKEATKKR